MFKWLLLFLVFVSCSVNENGIKKTYKQYIEFERALFEASFKGAQSVLKKEDISRFKGLSYFPIDTAFIFNSSFEIIQNSKPIMLSKGEGISDQYYPILKAKFKIDSKELELTGYSKNQSEKSDFFIPFNDVTSGGLTYGGGRFIDVKLNSNQQLIIDFNLCYNPYCAYNSNYICPIPPYENHLPVKILAGEKLPLIENHL